jgi:2,3-bisphosphoglycerate-independent phosphoglycerate mutase
MVAKHFLFFFRRGIMARMARVTFIFLDGCGVGPRGEGNPFFLGGCRHLPFWRGGMTLPDGTPISAIDATLGIPGAPQSASGQTALFCGASAEEIGGHHRNGYPDRLLRQVILEKNLLTRLAAAGAAARFLNAYPAHHELFTAAHIRLQADGRLWFSPSFPERFKKMISVTSCMLLASGQTPFGEQEIRAGRALYQDYSNRSLGERGLPLPVFSPQKAARVLGGASRRFDLVLYEYFQTDLFAHRRSMAECVALVRDLDALVGTLLSLLDRRRDTLLLTSDHGNLEEHARHGHTRNPVPLVAWGEHGARLRRKVRCIGDVAPAILDLY